MEVTKQQSEQWRHEHDANCNTCKRLERIKHEKRSDGFLLGICMGDGQNLQFHPHDPMHMPCYVSRWTT